MFAVGLFMPPGISAQELKRLCLFTSFSMCILDCWELTTLNAENLLNKWHIMQQRAVLVLIFLLHSGDLYECAVSPSRLYWHLCNGRGLFHIAETITVALCNSTSVKALWFQFLLKGKPNLHHQWVTLEINLTLFMCLTDSQKILSAISMCWLHGFC